MALVEMPQLPVLKQLIGSARISSAPSIPVINPSTGQQYAEQANATAEDVDLAVRAAAQAFVGWRRTTAAERSAGLLQLADALDAEAENFARLEALDAGKPITTAREEMPYMSDPLRYFAGAIRVAHGVSLGDVGIGLHSRVEREPIGVIGLIVPWNAPLLETVWKIGPALAAGNTVVLKMSQNTPLTATRLIELANEIFPAGVLNLIIGDSTGGRTLAAHPGVSMLSLTGSTNTGKQVAATGAQSLKRMHLELGGNAPVLVHPDADLAAAASFLVTTGYTGAGQDCTQPRRLIEHESAYNEFVGLYVDRASQLVMGDALDEDTVLGPLSSARHHESVRSFIDRAKDYAEVALGGDPVTSAGYFVSPTVVLDPAQDSEIVQDEAFGPVVSIQKARNEDQMLEWANDVNHGLGASVWSNNLNVTQRAARELEFGTVWINTHMQVIPEAPFGGFKESGYGKELSMMALEEFSRYKHVMTQTQ